LSPKPFSIPLQSGVLDRRSACSQRSPAVIAVAQGDVHLPGARPARALFIVLPAGVAVIISRAYCWAGGPSPATRCGAEEMRLRERPRLEAEPREPWSPVGVARPAYPARRSNGDGGGSGRERPWWTESGDGWPDCTGGIRVEYTETDGPRSWDDLFELSASNAGAQTKGCGCSLAEACSLGRRRVFRRRPASAAPVAAALRGSRLSAAEPVGRPWSGSEPYCPRWWRTCCRPKRDPQHPSETGNHTRHRPGRDPDAAGSPSPTAGGRHPGGGPAAGGFFDSRSAVPLPYPRSRVGTGAGARRRNSVLGHRAGGSSSPHRGDGGESPTWTGACRFRGSTCPPGDLRVRPDRRASMPSRAWLQAQSRRTAPAPSRLTSPAAGSRQPFGVLPERPGNTLFPW